MYICMCIYRYTHMYECKHGGVLSVYSSRHVHASICGCLYVELGNLMLLCLTLDTNSAHTYTKNKKNSCVCLSVCLNILCKKMYVSGHVACLCLYMRMYVCMRMYAWTLVYRCCAECKYIHTHTYIYIYIHTEKHIISCRI